MAPPAANFLWEACSSSYYNKTYEMLSDSRLEIHLDLANLTGKHVLFFGHSFLRQIVDNLLAAGLDETAQMREVAVSHNISFEHGGCGAPHHLELSIGTPLDLQSPHDHQVYTWTLRTFSFTFVNNYGPLQHSSCLNSNHQGPLMKLLQQLPPVYAIVFMEPHPDCFFTYQELKAKGKPTEGCVDLQRDNQHLSRRCELNDIFSRYSQRVLEVLPWNTKTAVRCGNHTNPLASSTYVTSFPCEVWQTKHCAPGLGHQCNPGTLTFVAENLLHALAELLKP